MSYARRSRDETAHGRMLSAIACAEAELALTSGQRSAWSVFVGTVEEAARAMAAVDAKASHAQLDAQPALPDALEATCHQLAIRLASACRIASAATVLHRVLSLRQRARAGRLVTIVSEELSLASAERPRAAPAGVSSRSGGSRPATLGPKCAEARI